MRPRLVAAGARERKIDSRALLATLLVALSLVGCLRGDPLQWTVSAKDSRALALWRAKIDTAIGPENRRRLDEALQELRANIAGHRELNRWSSDNVLAGGKEAIDAAVCARIDGRPLREVLQLGYEFRVQRLQQEFAGLENAVKQNTRLVTRPDDVDSRTISSGSMTASERASKLTALPSKRPNASSRRW